MRLTGLILGMALPALLSGQPATRVLVEGGSFRPLYAKPGETAVRVAPFRLDARPVTRAEFEAFVRANPKWRRDSVSALMAGPGYLRDWAGPADAGSIVRRDAPVTGVSWHAARAYCAWRGGRLPTTNEWEFAARADEHRRDAADSPAFRQRALDLATTRASHGGFTDVRGIANLHGGNAEWVSDFHWVFGGGDARQVATREHDMSCAGGVTMTGDASDYAAFLRYAYRSSLEANSTVSSLGFRCAASQ